MLNCQVFLGVIPALRALMILTIKSPHKTISILLAMVLLVPANAGAATWMVLSMTSLNSADHMHAMDTEHHSTEGTKTDHGMHHQSQNSEFSQTPHHFLHADHQSHEHDEEECNEHCVSCANHCSSMAIPFDNFMLSDLSKQSQRFESGNLNSFSELLFRPPING